MKKFVLVYYGGSKAEDMKPEDVDEVMAAWGAWYEKLGEAVVDGGNPFASNAQKVGMSGVSDVADEEWPSKGYTIVQAESIDEAVKMAQSNPMLASEAKDGDEDVQVRVYECLPM